MTGSASSDGPIGPNPYVGPRPFEPGETLYGREQEITELEDLWSAERIVLLHALSGAGKSSLLQAGLLPRLRTSFDIWGPTRVNQEPAINSTPFAKTMRHEERRISPRSSNGPRCGRARGGHRGFCCATRSWPGRKNGLRTR